MKIANENIQAQIQRIVDMDGTIEDLLFLTLEYLSIAERSATLNPDSVNRVLRTQQDTNTVLYSVSILTQPAFDDASGFGVTYEAVDYLPDIAPVTP